MARHAMAALCTETHQAYPHGKRRHADELLRIACLSHCSGFQFCQCQVASFILMTLVQVGAQPSVDRVLVLRWAVVERARWVSPSIQEGGYGGIRCVETSFWKSSQGSYTLVNRKVQVMGQNQLAQSDQRLTSSLLLSQLSRLALGSRTAPRGSRFAMFAANPTHWVQASHGLGFTV